MTTLWYDVRSSLFGFCAAFARELQTDGDAAMTVFNWDAHVEQNALPEVDLIGPWQVSMDLDFKLITVRGHIGISMFRDTNLFRLEEASGRLLEKLAPDQFIPLSNAETGEASGHLKLVEGTTLSPVAQAQQRTLKFVSFVAKSDRTIG